MEENIKLQIRKNIIEHILLTIDYYDLKNYTTEYFDEIIDDIFDLSKNSIANINEYQTYLFRKRFGIFDNGRKQTTKDLTIELERSNQAILKALNKIILKIVSYSNEKYIANLIKLGKIDTMDIEICDLDLSVSCYHYLMKHKLSKVGIICSYTTYELENIISAKKVLEEICDKIHSLGLYFALEDKKYLYYDYPKTKIRKK